jgi:predicted short-subunit dehydrogenase-like oxidoreductase (DUF2520 family)
VGRICHPSGRVVTSVCSAFIGALIASASLAAGPHRVAVEVSFVESAEITVANLPDAGTADPSLAITSSPGRIYTILTDSPVDNADNTILTVSYQ